MIRNKNGRKPMAAQSRRRTRGAANGARRRRLLCVETLENRRLLIASFDGDEFRVNQVVAGSQTLPASGDAVAVDHLGNLLVAYTGPGADKATDVFVQRFLADGSPAGGQVRVNSYTKKTQELPAIAVGPQGEYVVAWSGNGSSDDSGIYFRRYTADGVPSGGEQRANATTKDRQTRPSIAMDADGNFAIAWAGRGSGDNSGVFLRRFHADGTPDGGEIRVNLTTKGTQGQPDLTFAADGTYAVAWMGQGPGDSAGIFLQRLAADGSRLGGEVRLNSTISGVQQFPAVVGDETGGVIAVWSGKGAGDSAGVFWRRMDAAGLLGPEVRVNAGTAGVQQYPALAGMGDGSYVVTWAAQHLPFGQVLGWDIKSRQLDASGQYLTDDIQVSQHRLNGPVYVSLGSNQAGRVVTAWSGTGWGAGAGIYARGLAGSIDPLPPVIQAGLQTDTGLSATDRLTADATVQGQIFTAGALGSLRAGLDLTPVGNFADILPLVQTNGAFVIPKSQLEALASGGLVDGPHVLHLQAANTTGATAAFDLSFVLDTASPGLQAALTQDTGSDHSDGITANTEIRGTVQDRSQITRLEAAFADVPNSPWVEVNDLFQIDGSFTISAARQASLFGSPLPTGPHTLRLRASDEHGFAAPTEVSFTFDTSGPPITRLDLSSASDSGQIGDQKTSAARVVIVGQTDPLVTLTLAETGAVALSSKTGLFQFPGVSLERGLHTFTVIAANSFGNPSQRQITLEGVSEAVGVDPVLRWNQTLLEAVRLDAATPLVASRALAMVHMAMFDVLSAIERTPSYLVAVAAPAGASLEAAISATAERVLGHLFPAQATSFAATLAASLAALPDGPAQVEGVALGREVADGVIAVRDRDGWDEFVVYSPQEGLGQWQPTPPMFDSALAPQWAKLEPFALQAPDQFRPPGPPALGSQAWADAYEEVRLVGRLDSTSRTAEQTQIARFWADGPGTYTPPGHWNQVAEQAALAAGSSLGENVRLFAQLNVALADAAIAAWDAKYHYETWRPITAIHGADLDGNALTVADADWSPLLITPAFPEYVSGHSTFSGAAAAVLTAAFGDDQAFSTTSVGLPGVTRSFAGFTDAAAEAGQSRIYGGIHFQFANQDGQTVGRAIAAHVLDTFSLAGDDQPPRVLVDSNSSPAATRENFTLTGRALDNLSGVSQLEVQLDDGTYASVIVDAAGRFAIPTRLRLNGQDDGSHVLRLRATDAVGNNSPSVDISFTLDTAAPIVSILGPVAGANLSVGAELFGQVLGGGSPLSEFRYAFDAQIPRSIPLPAADGSFRVPLDLSRLAPGNHTLRVTASDAAGNSVTTSLAVALSSAAPLTIVETYPDDGAIDVGSTFRPKVVFSRPIDSATLSTTNFYATSPSGAKLPARIVVGGDGTFAWLFFADPLPGGAQITIHLDGSTIRAQGDLQPLDADGDGLPGGATEFRFTTVSLTPLVGTTLRGKVVDPGVDLKPMTFDDLRAGPDGALFTGDDVFLLPIAGAKVWIVGLEDQFVLTDAQGNFQFDTAPAGDVKFAIDGRTGTGGPAGVFFPEMVLDLRLDPGRNNTVMGSMGTAEERAAFRDRAEVYLPRLENSILHAVSPTQRTTIGVDARSAPNLTPQQRGLLTIDISPGSLLDEHGNPVASGQVGISTVPAELVREMLPPGVLQHTFDITIQAPGITNFSTPAAMTFPNIFHSPPGTQLNFLSFDHTTGRLVIDGTATVSVDGLSVTTDPGQGITHPGWHGLPPPGGPGGPDCFSINPPTVKADAVPVEAGLKDYLFSKDGEGGLISFGNAASIVGGGGTCSSANQAASSMLVEIVVSPEAQRFLSGLQSQNFSLQPGQIQNIRFQASKQAIAKLKSDALYGARLTVTIRQLDPNGIVRQLRAPETIYLYRYVDALDDHSDDGLLKFNDALNDGTGGVVRFRDGGYFGDPAAKPDLSVNSPSGDFRIFQLDSVSPGSTASSFQFQFDPTHTEENLGATLRLQTPRPSSRQVTGPSALSITGNGTGPLTLYADAAGLEQQLAYLANDASTVNIVVRYNSSLLNPLVAPTYFQISLPGEPTSNTTIPLRVGADTIDVTNALMQLGSIGLGGVEVHLTKEQTNAPLNTKDITDTYQIHPKGAFALRPTPVFSVLDTSGTRLISAGVTRNSPQGLLTQNQRDLLATPQLRAAFVQDVLFMARTYFLASGPSVIISPDANSTPGAFRFDWSLNSDPTETAIARFDANSLQPLKTFVSDVFANPAALNRNQVAFRLAQILGDSLKLTGLNHRGTGYVNRMFKPNPDLPADASRSEIVRYIGTIIAHEFGHGLGLPHTAVTEAVNIVAESQLIELLGGNVESDTFTLTFAGANTAPLGRNSTPLQVQEALLKLSGLAGSDLRVTGANGGPYAIYFVDPSLPAGTPSLFSGVQVPQIDGFGANLHVSPSTLNEGGAILKWPREVRIGLQKGRDDIMVAATTLRQILFLPSVSQTLLRLSLGLNWGAEQGSVATSVVFQAANIGQLITTVPLPGQVFDDPEAFLYEGRGLAVFSEEGLLADTLDFGAVSIDGAGHLQATRRLTLRNFGGQDVVVRSIQVSKAFDQFFVPPIPVTTLHPGETLDVEVTFDPAFSGAASGILSIDSDAAGFQGELDLVGVGQRTTADLRADLLNDNFGGNAVGQFMPEQRRGAILTNYGVLPVTITAVRVAAGPGESEFFVGPFAYPVTLQPGESHEVLMQFRPGAAGLRNGVLEILSDDPQSPIIRKPLVGTGLVEGNLDYGNDFVALERSFSERFGNPPVLRTRSDAGGNWEFFLGPETQVHIATFDPVSGRIAHGYATTNPSGQRTSFHLGEFRASGDPDTDGDGLPDDIEFAIGTDPNKIDTDGDALSDFDEVGQGLDPLDDRPTITGIIAALGLTSPTASANDISLVADTRDTSRVTAYMATSEGLAIADVSQFDRPRLLSELVLPGFSSDVEVDPQRQFAAVASGAGGLHLINVSDSARPVLVRTIPVNASRVALFDGLAYVAVGNEIQSFDVVSGEPVETLSLGDGDIGGLRREGTLLFATNRFALDGKLHAIDLAGLGMVARGSLVLPRAGADLFVAEGVAWIASNGVATGLMTVDVSQPDNLRLLSDSDRGTRLVRGVALNGSGLGIIAGRNLGGAAGGTAIVVTAENPTVTAPTFTQFVLPQLGQAVALSSGLAYIADGTAGLQVISFLAFDQGKTPPVVSLGALGTDVDPGRPGIQMQEASTVTLSARITDDVQVRSVELLVDGVRVSSDVSYPYDLATTLPKIAQTGTEAVLQVRATDTGGNVRLSAPVVIELLPDLVPPAIVALDPPDGSTQAISRRQITIRFSESLAPLTATVGNFELLGPSGRVTPLSMQVRQSSSLIELYYPPLTEGNYQLVIHASAVTDRVDNALGASDLISRFRIASIVREPTIQWINPVGGFWDDPANWENARLPGLNDDVRIDMPGDPTITFRQGDVQVRTLVSENPFRITGGRLIVSETSQVNDSFTLRSTSSSNIATLGGVVLRGSGGQGLKIGGFSRLEAATIQTDLTITESGTQLRIKNGLALFGTATLGTSVALGFEGSQQVTSGTFLLPAIAATQTYFGPSIEAIGAATVTFGSDVLVHGGTGVFGQQIFFGQNTLNLINYGRISADVAVATIRMQGESLTNHGVLEAKAGGALLVNDKIWTNTVTGRITASDALFPSSASQIVLGLSQTKSWSNAGTISLTNTFGIFNSGTSDPGDGWSNTGTILVQNSFLFLQGQFTSADVQNIRQSDNRPKRIDIRGRLDNTGRTLTFTTQTGSMYLTEGGQIIGGTLNMTGPDTRLEFASNRSGGGILNGVTINGDIEFGEPVAAGTYHEQVRVVNGLTVNGNVTFHALGTENFIIFEGVPQTVFGANFRNPVLSAFNGGPVTLDASVTIRSTEIDPSTNRGLLSGNFINQAPMTVEPNTVIAVSGALAGPFINRGSVHVEPRNAAIPGGTFSLTSAAVNEGAIFADRATLRLGGPGWRNTGVIEASLTEIEFGDGASFNRIRTSDLGTIRNPGGTITLTRDMVLDNTGSTLVIDSTLADQFVLGGNGGAGAILGGTIQVAASSHFLSSRGILQDLTVQGDLELYREGSLTLGGDLTFQGTVHARSGFFGPRLDLGYGRLTPNLPVVIHAGTLDFGGRQSKTIGENFSSVGDNTFGPDVVLRGRNVQATFTKPLLNQGSIIAELVPEFPGDTIGNAIQFTNSPITNAGLLESKSGGLLSINNLVSNRGTIRAGAGSVVSVGGNLPQNAAGTVAVEIVGLTTNQFGRITAAGTAILAGALNVQFAGGFTPAAGDSFQVMTYAAVSGTFDTVQVTGLPAGLVAVPIYDATNLTIVVGAGLAAPDRRPSPGDTVALDPALLPAFVQEALARWIQAGVYPELVDRAARVQWHVADLPGHSLGMTADDAVWLDADAGGYRWFVDDSPGTDEEFSWQDGALQARRGDAADGRMDLLTAVMHELGHVVGLEDLLAGDDASLLMSGTLQSGVRKLPGSRTT